MIRLHWHGLSNLEIAAKLGYTPQEVSNILNAPEALAILGEMRNLAIDTMGEVAAELQAVAPIALSRKIDLLGSSDDRVANTAATDLLHMAGHAPVKRLQVSQPTSAELKYEGLNEAELREKLLEELGGRPGLGPDGKRLN